MDKFVIKGPCKVNGAVLISGSKNASLPILASTILLDKTVTIGNLPRVKDIDTMLNLLKSLGSKINISKDRKTVEISKTKNIRSFASYSLVKTMRAGILVLGPLLAKFKKAQCSMPGGCNLGLRPIDIHLKSLSKLGAKFKIIKGYVHAEAKKGILGNEIKFSKIKGTEITKLGSRGASNPAIKTTSPNSNISQSYYWIGSAGEPKDFSRGTDFNAIMNNKISVTPLKIDQTDYDSLSFSKKLVE